LAADAAVEVTEAVYAESRIDLGVSDRRVHVADGKAILSLTPY
jgi:hypothetical protein